MHAWTHSLGGCFHKKGVQNQRAQCYRDAAVQQPLQQQQRQSEAAVVGVGAAAAAAAATMAVTAMTMSGAGGGYLLWEVARCHHQGVGSLEGDWVSPEEGADLYAPH